MLVSIQHTGLCNNITMACRPDFTHAMVGKSTQGSLLEVQQRINQRLMKRNNSSAEDMVRSMMKPNLDRISLENGHPTVGSWRIADRCAAPKVMTSRS